VVGTSSAVRTNSRRPAENLFQADGRTNGSRNAFMVLYTTPPIDP
jgi:hypothetical protein